MNEILYYGGVQVTCNPCLAGERFSILKTSPHFWLVPIGSTASSIGTDLLPVPSDTYSTPRTE